MVPAPATDYRSCGPDANPQKIRLLDQQRFVGKDIAEIAGDVGLVWPRHRRASSTNSYLRGGVHVIVSPWTQGTAALRPASSTGRMGKIDTACSISGCDTGGAAFDMSWPSTISHDVASTSQSTARDIDQYAELSGPFPLGRSNEAAAHAAMPARDFSARSRLSEVEAADAALNDIGGSPGSSLVRHRRRAAAASKPIRP